MEAIAKECHALRDDMDKLQAGQDDRLAQLLDALHGAKRGLETTATGGLRGLQDAQAQVKTVQTTVKQGLNDVYASVNRFTKAVEKKFNRDLSSLDAGALDSAKSHDLLDRVIALHFIRSGSFSVAQVFSDESSVPLPEATMSQFAEMFRILSDLKAGGVALAIAWADSHHAALRSRGSTLEYDLKRLHFIALVQAKQVQEALLYARHSLAPFIHEHMSDITRLFGSILFDQQRESPYDDIYQHVRKKDKEDKMETDGAVSDASGHQNDPLEAVQIRFVREFCALIGLSAEAPLLATTTASLPALPILSKMHNVLSAHKNTEWSAVDELAVEVTLPPHLRFHSIFACPVSKEQATEANPPMMLVCGHVLALESVQKLGKGPMGKLKCPYCPTEGTTAAAQRIYF